MSRNWGRTPVTNADKRLATQTKYLVEVDGGTEERIDRRPLGKVERFVDPAGNIVSLQLFADGDPQRATTEVRQRTQLHRKGFVEYAKCPLKHGTRHSSDLAKKDFAKLPESLSAECKQDPKVMRRQDGDLYAGESCPHIEWLITARVKKAAADYKKRNALAVKKEEADEKRRKLDALELEKRERDLGATEAVQAERRQRVAAKPREVIE